MNETRFPLIPRNPLIAKAFFWIKFAEDVGSGTSKIIQWCKDWGLPEPSYEEAGGSFVTIFHNPKQEKDSEKAREKVREKTREKILRLIEQNPEITTAKIAEETGITTKGIEWNINKLKKEGAIKRIGPDKGGHWEVVK